MKNTIKVERAKLNISQSKLAEEVGACKQTIHKIETRKTMPNVKLSLKIARFFGLEFSDIFTAEEEI